MKNNKEPILRMPYMLIQDFDSSKLKSEWSVKIDGRVFKKEPKIEKTEQERNEHLKEITHIIENKISAIMVDEFQSILIPFLEQFDKLNYTFSIEDDKYDFYYKNQIRKELLMFIIVRLYGDKLDKQTFTEDSLRVTKRMRQTIMLIIKEKKQKLWESFIQKAIKL